MCGLAGILSRDPISTDRLARAASRIAHRGPDAQGTWSATTREGWSVQLLHSRLSIIDVAGSPQPMRSADSRSALVYNGEVFNFKRLRPALSARGASFATRGDTEVVLNALTLDGSRALESFNGMFALAFWDDPRQELLLARDRYGIKPLYLMPLEDGGLAFASELTALLPLQGSPPRLSESGLLSYLFLDYAAAPESLVHGIRKLEPGHCISWQGGRLGAPRRFARAVHAVETGKGDPSALADELWERLSRSVSDQLESDVPLGIFLSGGLDSSTVASLAKAAASGPVTTFSIAFEDQEFDESPYARQVARHLGTQHVERTLSEGSLLEILDAALTSLDEPLADPSYLPTYLLSELASRHVKVALGGDGGDEVFGGYPTYRAHRLAALYAGIPSTARRLARRAAGLLGVSDGYQSLGWKLRRFTERWDDDALRRHFRWMSSTDLPELEALRGRPIAPSVDPLAGLLERLDRRELMALDPVTRAQRLDLGHYLPGSVLTKVDRASMAFGLEVRPPFLDHELVDWAFGLDSSLKLRGKSGKWLLKRAALRALPREIVERPKRGFAIPLSRWCKGPLKARLEAVLNSSPLWDGMLNRDGFAREHGEHQAGSNDHSKTLWAVLVLDHWIKKEGIHA